MVISHLPPFPHTLICAKLGAAKLFLLSDDPLEEEGLILDEAPGLAT